MTESVGILGNGKLARALAQGLSATANAPLFIAARNWSPARQEHFAGYKKLSLDEKLPEADILFFCVSDTAIAELGTSYSGRLLNIHGSGSTSLDIFPQGKVPGAVFWPVHSFTDEPVRWSEIPVVTDAASIAGREMLQDLCRALGVEKQMPLNDQERRELHLAAVFVSNFTNAMYAAAEEILAADTARMQMLLHLLRDTALRYKGKEAALLQTGPARRGDEPTMQRQREALQEHPLLNILYVAVSDYIRSLPGSEA